jgi:hypothetical protein
VSVIPLSLRRLKPAGWVPKWLSSACSVILNLELNTRISGGSVHTRSNFWGGLLSGLGFESTWSRVDKAITRIRVGSVTHGRWCLVLNAAYDSCLLMNYYRWWLRQRTFGRTWGWLLGYKLMLVSGTSLTLRGLWELWSGSLWHTLPNTRGLRDSWTVSIRVDCQLFPFKTTVRVLISVGWTQVV